MSILPSGFWTVTSMSFFLIVTSEPFLMASITVAKVAKAKSSPVAARTLGSIAPVGGSMKETIMRMTDKERENQNALFDIC